MVPLDEILDTFERLWREKKPRPVLAEFLGQFSLSGSQRTEALVELIAIDMEYHWRADGPQEVASQADTASGSAAAMADTRPDLFASRPLIEDYAKQWPEILGDNPRAIELMAEEYRIRHRWGDCPSAQEYIRRFGERRELRDALEEVRQELLADLGENEAQTVILPSPFEGVETNIGKAEDTVSPFLQEFGRYRLLKSLGQGGMGQVFLAEDSHLERRVALKMPHLEEGAVLRDRFVNEAKAAAMLRHSGICPVFDAGEVDGQPFLTMAFIEGETLREHWRRGDRVSPVEMLQVLIETARAMQVAHAAGIVHRDLKPSNVMIDENGHAVVMDFGLAYRATIPQDERITQTGDTLGTPGYMSPEQVEGPAGEIGPASDIYSLGVMLFEALTGRLPFTGSVSSILIQIARDQPTAPSDWKKDIDAELEQFCLQLLSKDPKARPQSMRDVADRLAAIQRRLKVESATPAAGSSPAKASSSRKPAWKKRSALALAVLGIVLVLGAIVFRIQTPYGTVTVEVASEAAKDVQVRVLKEGKVIEVANASSGWSVKLEEGEYEFDLGQAEASFSISPRTVRISRGETEIVKVAIAANALGEKGQTIEKPKTETDSGSPRDAKDFALSFDGQDDYVEIPTLTYDGSHPLTIEAWVTTYSRPSYAGIIGNKTRSGEPGGLSLMFISLMGERFWHVGVNGASAKGQNAYVWPSDERFEKVEVGKRTHIAGVWDGQRLTLFVNGWKNDNMVSDGVRGPVDRVDLVPSKASFLFGAEIPSKLHFEGAIDEVRFSKRVRYRKDFTPPESFKSDEDTLALYHFDEGSGDVLKDTSGHGHDGKIHGALWVPGPKRSALPEHDAAIAATPRENAPALFFDGVNDFVHVPYAPVEGRPPLTIEAWIRPEAGKARWGKGLQGYIVGTAGWATGLGLAVVGPMEVMGASIKAPDNQNIGDAVQRPELGEWSHVAAVWTDDALRFYWNGRLKKEWPLDYNQIPNWSSWRLGRRSDDTPIGFHGAMREVRISTVARYKDHFRPQWRFEPDEQTLALYHFREGAGDVLIDSSGQGRYGRHGRIVGAEWTPSKSEVPPEENRALSFDGVDDHVITPLVYDGSHPITVEAWAAAADPWEWGTIISNNSGHPNGFKFAHESHSHNPIWTGGVFGGDSSRPLAHAFRRPDYEPKTHLAMVWDGEEFRLYVNGETQQSTISPLKQMPGSQERIRLGTQVQAGVLASEHWHRFHGLVDEVRISKVARYDAKFQPSNRFEPDEDTWALYHCDEADSDVLKDASGNRNDARIYGGATRKPAFEMHSPSEYYRQLDDWVRQTARKMPERSGPALEFSTTNAHVEVPAVDFDFTKPFTVEAWATPKGNWMPNSPSREVVRLGDLELKIDPNSKIWTFHSWDGRGLWAGPWGKDMMLWNRRTHVVGQWDGKQMRLFLNGIPCPGEVITLGFIDNLQEFIHDQFAAANGSTIRIGSYDQEGGTFGGTIDRFRLSRGARYEQPFEPTDFKSDDSTIVMFDFHEGQGDVLHDLSGNGYHGKIVGAKWVGGEGKQQPAKAEKPKRD